MVKSLFQKAWGLVPGPRSKQSRPVVRDLPAASPVSMRNMGQVVHLEPFCCPADDQGYEPSCAGFAISNPREVSLRRNGVVVPYGFQIDGRKVWQRGRKDHHGGDLSGGLTMRQAFDAALKEGVYPKGTTLVEVPKDEIVEYMARYGALIAGHDLSQAYNNPDRVNGYVNPYTTRGMLGPHGWNLISIYEQAGNRYFRMLSH